jgi:hypothetical protein
MGGILTWEGSMVSESNVDVNWGVCKRGKERKRGSLEVTGVIS